MPTGEQSSGVGARADRRRGDGGLIASAGSCWAHSETSMSDKSVSSDSSDASEPSSEIGPYCSGLSRES